MLIKNNKSRHDYQQTIKKNNTKNSLIFWLCLFRLCLLTTLWVVIHFLRRLCQNLTKTSVHFFTVQHSSSTAHHSQLLKCAGLHGLTKFIHSLPTRTRLTIILPTIAKIFTSDPSDHTKYWIFLICWYTKERGRNKSCKSWVRARIFAVVPAMTNTRMLSIIEVNCALKDYKYAHRQIEKGVERTDIFSFQPTQQLEAKLHNWVIVGRRYNFSASLWSAGAASVMYLSSR